MAKPLHCAAIDLGATSGRVILGTWAKGRLSLQEVHRFPNALRSAGGHDYWDIPGLWQEVQAGLRAAVAALPKGATLASVGVDTWGVDYVLTNDAGRIVFPTHAYRDARTQVGLTHLTNTRAALQRIYAATGIPAVFYNSSLQLAETVEKCPAITDLATRCLFLPDYFNFLLSGQMANGLSIASTTQLLDVHGDDWSRVALDYFRVPPVWLTKPVPTGARLGRLRPEALSLPNGAGLEQTQVIAVPGHDTTCAYDAMPAAADGADIFLSSGTWSLVGFESDQPLLGPAALTARVANDRTGRGEYRPLVNVLGLWLLEQTLKDFATRPKNDREWSALISAANRLPLTASPLDMIFAEFANPPSMKAAIDAQLKRRKLPLPKTLAGYVRLICDSLGAGHAMAIRDFEQLSGRTFKRILMVGGGAKNRLLCQATANAAGLPVHAFAIEGSVVGNLANQLIALKAVKNLAAFRASLAADLKQTIYQPR
ncbi:Rhamnulokinase [Lacunisphaera limnophila]|uniref:Rhamnulokinase n=1 Tax=Lacunisphaera limnophila TaxID=1838286 RepID=A0A1D8ATP6_9BACT|nr:FGGY-family carbohydrate kinase [Lacunisphaera limnophila]AOS44257.1 Rhamnulokinase [Lacunisphaera limnophila]